MDVLRIRKDIKYILLNCVINRIPSWMVRRMLYRKLGLKIGDGSRIGIKTIIDEPKNICIGEHTIINEFCHLDGRGGLSIGNNTSISVYTKILSASHYSTSETFEYYVDSVSIGDNVWIGMAAIVLDGSDIKDESIIGAGCVFKGTTESGRVYVGNPARMLKERNLRGKYIIEYNPYFR